MRYLRQSTAVVVPVGPFLDDADAKTAETALTVASINVDLYKGGATKTDLTITASGGSNDMAHVADGYYSLELTATDTETVGLLRATFSISGALPFYEDFIVLPANVYDSMVAGTDNLLVESVSQFQRAYSTPGTADDVVYSLADFMDKVREVQLAMGHALSMIRSVASVERSMLRQGESADAISTQINTLYPEIVAYASEVPAVLEALWNVNPLHKSVVKVGTPGTYAQYDFDADDTTGKAVLSAELADGNPCTDGVFSCFQAGDTVTLSGSGTAGNNGDFVVSSVHADGRSITFTTAGAADETALTDIIATLKVRP